MNLNDIINNEITTHYPELNEVDIIYDIEILMQRVLIFLNLKEVPNELIKIILNSYYKNYKKNQLITSDVNGEIESISDNGQSLKFKSKKESYNFNEIENSFFNELLPILELYKKNTKKLIIAGEETQNAD